MIPTIGDNLQRRHDLLQQDPLAGPVLNGIDYLEVPGEGQLRVFFLHNVPTDAYGLTRPPFDQVQIAGGVRVKSIRVVKVEREVKSDGTSKSLLITLDRPGDLSRYTLRLNAPLLDPVFGQIDFVFRPGTRSQFDMGGPPPAAAPQFSEPLIEYRAKDYASFRQVLTDFVKTRVPTWHDHPADLGTALLELMAYTGDQLSYYQDGVMNEAWLTTARQRESVRRHALLVDYRMHEGCAARTFVHVRIGPRADAHKMPPYQRDFATGTVPGSTQVYTVQTGLEGETAFTVLADTPLHEALNEMRLWDWGSRSSYLPKGATQFDLQGALPLQPGHYLALEEVVSPVSGRPSEANPTRRQVVRVQRALQVMDPLKKQPVTRVLLAEEDRLEHDFVVTTETADRELLSHVTLVRGNLLPAEHGRLVTETFAQVDPVPGQVFRLRLGEGPLTFQAPFDLSGPASLLLQPDSRQARPRVSLAITPPEGTVRTWHPVADLLSSGAFAEVFVAETDTTGQGSLRFGDGYQGRRPARGSKVVATYATGNGLAGNVGADSLVVLGRRPGAPSDAPNDGWSFAVLQVRNPIPSFGGTDQEEMEQVRRLAPVEFHRKPLRAVTAEDYAAAAEEHAGVTRAVARLAWTGSWYTVDVTVDPAGRSGLTPALRDSLIGRLQGLQLSGYDLRISEPVYVPLEIALTVEIAPGNRRLDVQEAVLEALSNVDLPGGRQGLFHPDRFTFGQPMYLSHLYAAVEAVPGVLSVQVNAFKRYGYPDGSELAAGVITAGRVEIIRCDNDPNYPENGFVRLTMRGGL